ncbi:hypothetical protein AYO22_00209 [Fonsecaea multimorphosa]|nr:hypothetical protein AYO22_00209 [Fonsecaea multimorphosa]
MELNGQTCRIPSAVDKALRRVRALNFRRVWVDQVCINQRDTSERNQQVSRMNDIYAGGTECFVYLGEGTGHDEDVDWLVRWVAQLRRTQSTWNLKEFLKLNDHNAFPGQRRPWQRCIDYIFQESYFTRTWVLQEIFFSTKTTCLIGSKRLSWGIIEALANEIPITAGSASNRAANEKIHRTPDNLPDLNAWSRLWQPFRSTSALAKAQDLGRFTKFMSLLTISEDRRLLSLLRHTRDLRTTDPRDKIFALINIADDGKSFPSPDYVLSVEDVYNLYTRIFAERGYATRILSMSHYKPENRFGPSWVPLWDRSIPDFNFETDTRFNAGGNRISPSHCSNGHLVIEAYHLNSIDFRSATFKGGNFLLRDLAAFIDDFLLSRPYYLEELSINTLHPESDIVDLLFCDSFDDKKDMFREPRDMAIFGPETLDRMHGSVIHAFSSHGAFSQWTQISYYENVAEFAFRVFSGKPDAYGKFKNRVLRISPTEQLVQQVVRCFPRPRFLEYLRGDLMPFCLIFALVRSGDRQTQRQPSIGFASSACRPTDKIMLVKGARAPYIFRQVGATSIET